MSSPRTSRRLDLNVQDSSLSISSVGTVEHSGPTRAELRELFRDEINTIIESEKKSAEEKIKKELEIEFNSHKNEMEKKITAQIAELKDEKSKLDALIKSIKKSYQDKISEDIGMLDELVIEITMQSLYRMVGDADIYKELVEKNIHEILEKKSAGSSVLIKVSESEMKFLKQEFVNSAWINYLRIDEKLTDGEMVLDDGIASLYEMGFVNQLDVLRAAFLKLLREQHAN